MGDKVYVYREDPKSWIGPTPVIRIDGKKIFVEIDRQGPKAFSISRVKRATSQPTFNWTEVLEADDPRAHTPEMEETKRKEFVGLLNRGTFRLVMLPKGGKGENVIPSRFVLALKHKSNGETKAKARFVCGGHKDARKGQQLLSNSRKISPTGCECSSALLPSSV